MPTKSDYTSSDEEITRTKSKSKNRADSRSPKSHKKKHKSKHKSRQQDSDSDFEQEDRRRHKRQHSEERIDARIGKIKREPDEHDVKPRVKQEPPDDDHHRSRHAHKREHRNDDRHDDRRQIKREKRDQDQHQDRNRDRRDDRDRDRRQRSPPRQLSRWEPNDQQDDRQRHNRRREENHRRRPGGNPFQGQGNSEKETWGKPGTSSEGAEAAEAKDKEMPNFELSGKLTEDTNTFRGVVIKYNEPEEARKPKRKWRLYPFKGEDALPVLHIHRQSAYLMGRDRKVADIPIDHPSCSKQHAAFQYRLVGYERDDGTAGRRVRPYIIDLESSNGTYVNNQRIDSKRYVELFEKDVLKFGFSSREYVLLHDSVDTSEVQDEGED